jgi:hypothetical protein
LESHDAAVAVESGAAAAIAGERRIPEAVRGDVVDQSQTLS